MTILVIFVLIMSQPQIVAQTLRCDLGLLACDWRPMGVTLSMSWAIWALPIFLLPESAMGCLTHVPNWLLLEV